MWLSKSIALRIEIEVLHIFVFLAYAIIVAEPTKLFENSDSSSAKSTDTGEPTSTKLKHIKSKSWEELRQQLLENNLSSDTFQKRTLGSLGERLIQRSRRSVLTLKPTNSRKAQLLSCKLLNYNLAIMDNGNVLGLKNQSSPYVLLDLERYDGSLATIQHPTSKRYIGMDSNGTVYSTTTFGDEVLFNYLTGNYPYIQFSSYKYKHNGKDMLIGLRADGQTKKGRKVSVTHKSSQFLMVATI
ncbi:fibroblast growth factor 10 [Paramuricea clavata]|uniref:Fibroblast growth factor 10 n=1 Tax=Paramuricea clavata TaxID=317549 RepID=A0A7D9HBU4_PARCT|nr:fibroblast growth factor 10 [Paramuricea clavata]